MNDVTVQRRLSAKTAEGALFVELCEKHATAFAERAGEHDRLGSFGFANWEELKASGALRACIPTELGGLGVTSIHDVAVGISRLAEGDASMAIGANMHLTLPWAFTRHWMEARDKGQADAEARWAMTLQVFGSAVFAGPNTEPSNSVGLQPATVATPTDGGYLVNGRKIFGTNAPVADVLGAWVCVPDPDGGPPTMATVTVPRNARGVTIHDDWDALGMRASGSCSVTFQDCFVPDSMLSPIGTCGHWPVNLLLFLTALAFPLVATFVGIAEAALDQARAQVTTKRKGPTGRLLADRSGVQQLVAEAEVELAAARACLERSANLIDEYFTGRHPGDASEADLHQLMTDFQCTNLVVKRAAVAVVDRAMNAVGGSSYMSSSPLSRHWRDVRAGSFMQPFTPVEAYHYIASVALGQEPAVE